MSFIGRTIQVGDGYPVVISDAIQIAANHATAAMILRDKHPESRDRYTAEMLKHLDDLRTFLRRQMPQVEGDNSTDLAHDQCVRLAKWWGQWNVERGHLKDGSGIVPIRSTFDIHMDRDTDRALTASREATRVATRLAVGATEVHEPLQ